MQDQVSAGAVSGMAAAVIQIVYGWIVKGLGLTDRSFTDFAKVFFMYRNYRGLAASIVGFITQMLIGVILGMIFAFLITATSKRFYYLKGLGFGAIFWLGFGVAGTIFNLPLFKDIHPIPALMTLLGALLFGLVNSYVLKLIAKKTNLV
jgi:hypothetical protein